MKKVVLTIALAFILTTTYANNGNRIQNGYLLVTSLNTFENPGPNPFCKAIMEGDIETVKRLIALGMDINEKSLGMTPAMYAARYGKTEILQLLVQNDANLSVKSDEGFTAKKYAELSHAKEALVVIDSVSKG